MSLDFAGRSEVTPERTRAEIEAMLYKAGARSFLFAREPARSMLAFEHEGRRYRFIVHFPGREDPLVAWTSAGKPRLLAQREGAQKKLERARWRTLALSIKARLACVEYGLESFEDAFLAAVMLPGGRTVSEEVRPRIEAAYQSGKTPKLLPWELGHERL